MDTYLLIILGVVFSTSIASIDFKCLIGSVAGQLYDKLEFWRDIQ